MAAGDAHRVWFPEMVAHLRLRWRDDLSTEALLRLRSELDDMLGRIRSTRRISNPLFQVSRVWAHRRSSRQCSRHDIGADSRFGVPRRNRHGRLRRLDLPIDRPWDLICMATPQRKMPLDSQDARTPMNGKPMTDLIQPIARTESLSRDAGL